LKPLVPRDPADSERITLLQVTLETAVPMWAVTVASWTADRRMRAAHDAAEVIAHGADVLFHTPPRRPGTTAPRQTTREYRPGEVFSAIAKALAIGAHQPGGVTFLGRHWCTAPHASCPGVIPASLLPAPQLTVIVLADDPLGQDHTSTLQEVREDLGRRLAGVLPAEVVRASRLTGAERAARLAADTDLIAQHADEAIFGEDDGQVALRKLAEVVAILALQPGGVEFAGRHWCVTHDACETA
jgi:hypothetical protein